MYAKSKRENFREKCTNYLGGKVCNNPSCKRDWYPYASYDPHHIKGNKEFNISQMTNKPWNKVKEELDKCILLCAGCHRMFHYLKVKVAKTEEGLKFYGLQIWAT